MKSQKKNKIICYEEWKEAVVGIKILGNKEIEEEVWKKMKNSGIESFKDGNDEVKRKEIKKKLIGKYVIRAEYEDGGFVKTKKEISEEETGYLIKIGKEYEYKLKRINWKMEEFIYDYIKEKEKKWKEGIKYLLRYAGYVENENNFKIEIKEINEKEKVIVFIRIRNSGKKDNGIIKMTDEGYVIITRGIEDFRMLELKTKYYLKVKRESLEMLGIGTKELKKFLG
jgi:hypothetical protein